jgi:WD40 repeat protein
MQHSEAITGAIWNPDQTQVLTWTPDGQLRLWSEVGELVGGPWRHSAAVLGAAWNAAGDRILSWSEDSTAQVWSLDDVTLPVLSLPHTAAVTGARWSPDESRILTWTRDNRANNVIIWNTERGEQLAQLPHGSSSFGVQGAVWNGDGTRILSWSSNGVVRVWDVDRETGLSGRADGSVVDPQPLVTLRHDRFVNGAMWNSDESQVLSWATDDTARIWNLAGEELFVFNQNDAVNGAMWNGDESKVLTWNSAGLVKQWVVDVPTMIDIGRQLVVEPLSATERLMFFLSVATAVPA